MSPKPLAIHHTAISVRDLEKSIDFYTRLGFSKGEHYVAEDGSMHIVQLSLQGVGLELFWYLKNQGKPSLELEYANNLDKIGVKHLCLQVANAGDSLAWLKELGFASDQTEINIARSLQGSRYFFIQDPDGVWVEFMEDNHSR